MREPALGSGPVPSWVSQNCRPLGAVVSSHTSAATAAAGCSTRLGAAAAAAAMATEASIWRRATASLELTSAEAWALGMQATLAGLAVQAWGGARGVFMGRGLCNFKVLGLYVHVFSCIDHFKGM